MPSSRDSRWYALSETEWIGGSTSATFSSHAFLSQSRDVYGVADDPAPWQEQAHRVGRDYPQWVEPTVQVFDELLNLSEDWDSYGAAPISFENLNYAFQLLLFTMQDDSPPPNVIPTPEGSVELEWHEQDIDLEVQILAPYRIYVSYEDRRNSEKNWEDELTVDLTELSQAVRELSRRREDN